MQLLWSLVLMYFDGPQLGMQLLLLLLLLLSLLLLLLLLLYYG